MGNCGPKNKTKNNNINYNNKSNPAINKKNIDEIKQNKNNKDFKYNDTNINKISLSKTRSGLNINQIGDINNYSDIKYFEQTQ